MENWVGAGHPWIEQICHASVAACCCIEGTRREPKVTPHLFAAGTQTPQPKSLMVRSAQVQPMHTFHRWR